LAYSLDFAPDAERDLGLIFDFLFEAYVAFGESDDEASAHAGVRIRSIRSDISKLTNQPHRGTLHDRVLPGLRHVSFGRAVVWFRVDEVPEVITVLAVFFGGQDHERRMLARLLRKSD
jgi:toxin ParE1/3/4